ncbi:MAG: hypothetical protein JRJ87_15135, partial [Deltaproteobacteria bacterium]|nr:hypothetical protein [Deltaproteobacteria bacterium]
MAAMAVGLLAGCGSSKARRYELTKDDLAKHQQVLLVRGGPALVQLDVGMAGKLAMKGLNKIVESDEGSSFAQSLQKAGLLPRVTTMAKGAALLLELGWKVSQAEFKIESPGKDFNKIGLPDGACEEAASAGADSALILYQRLTIDVGATKSLAVSELWAHLFDCPAKQLLWRERDKRSLSLTKFVMNAAKQAITKENKTLADFLSSLRSLVEESAQAVLTKG